MDQWKVAENGSVFRRLAIVGAGIREAHEVAVAAFERHETMEEVQAILLVRAPRGAELSCLPACRRAEEVCGTRRRAGWAFR